MGSYKMLGNGRRSSNGTGAWLPDEVLRSRAYTDLTSGAKNVLVAIAAQYRGRGKNNGDLCVSVAVMKNYGIQSPAMIWRSEKQLRQHGLIVRTRKGMRQANQPNLYAITWKPLDVCGGKIPLNGTVVASNQWRTYQGTPLEIDD